MPRRRRTPLLVPTLATVVALALAACSTPVPIDPATLPQELSLTLANPDELSGAVYARVFEACARAPAADAGDPISPTQANSSRNAMPDGALSAAGALSGTLMPVAELARVNEAYGFTFGFGDLFFVPEGCDVTTVNPREAAFGLVGDWVVWDGTTVGDSGLPETELAWFDFTVDVGDVRTTHHLVASKGTWSAVSNEPCASGPSSSYVLDLEAVVGWQFLRITVDASGADGRRTTVETLSLDEVAAQGVIGRVTAPPAFSSIGAAAGRPTPIFR